MRSTNNTRRRSALPSTPGVRPARASLLTGMYMMNHRVVQNGIPLDARWGDVQFAETLFHEMAHQRLYINGDSDFKLRN